MTPTIIDGKEVAKKTLEKLKERVFAFEKKPSLAVIIAGNNEASKVYVKNKVKTAKEIGFNSVLIEFPENVIKEELLNKIEELNNDKNINAILLQLPLPKGLSEEDFLDKISPNKDVDGFNSKNAGKLFKNEAKIIPCTPKGILKLLKYYNIDPKGKVAMIIGRSNIVGRPLGALLLNNDATVIFAHSKTPNLKELSKNADILISATGKMGLIKKDMVKKGAVVIDVGIVRNKEGKLKGDVAFEEVFEETSFITPVPGGVGPMTIASLMENTLELYLAQEGQK